MFHYSSESGRVAACKAAQRPCPYGPEAHSPTAEAAREAYETSMSSHDSPPARCAG